MNRTNQKGLWIAVFGPDGVGKSAVIEQLEHQLAPVFLGISRFHFRPRFRRICEATPPVTNPHAKAPRGTIISLLKLLYWLADCWWGYLSTIIPRKYFGQLIFYDRYLPDLLVDPLRYRLPSDAMQFAALLLKLAPRPNLNILLDASAEVVQQRKSELSLTESRRQCVAYRNMFESLRSKLLVNADASVAEVSQQIAGAIHILKTEFSDQSRERSFVPNL